MKKKKQKRIRKNYELLTDLQYEIYLALWKAGRLNDNGPTLTEIAQGLGTTRQNVHYVQKLNNKLIRFRLTKEKKSNTV